MAKLQEPIFSVEINGTSKGSSKNIYNFNKKKSQVYDEHQIEGTYFYKGNLFDVLQGNFIVKIRSRKGLNVGLPEVEDFKDEQ